MSLYLILGGVALGLTLGFLGSGGSILAFPLLVYGLGLGTKEAIATSLVVVGATAFFGALPALYKREVCLRNAATFLVSSMPASFFVARFSVYLNATIQTVLFALLMLLVARRLLLNKNIEKTADHCNPRYLPLIVIGLGVGCLTGLLGVGGGFLIVPVLVLLGSVSFRLATGTSLCIITLNSLMGAIGYAGLITISWKIAFFILCFSVPSSWLAGFFSKKISIFRLQQIFAFCLVFLSGYMLWNAVR